MQTQDAIRIVSQSLAEKTDFDAKACDAIDVLARRLENLKAMSPLFENISFSQHAEELAHRHLAVSA